MPSHNRQGVIIEAPTRPGSSTDMARTFGDEIRRAREEKDWTQADLASKAGLSASTVHRIEKGKEPNGYTRRRLAEALEVPLSGHALSVYRDGALRPEGGAVQPSSMGQLVGHMMMHGGSAGADPFTVLMELAHATNEPDRVFRELARARSEAPVGADWSWWIRRYAEAAKKPDQT